MLKAKDDLRVIEEECEKLGFDKPELVKTELVQVDLDYSLIVGWEADNVSSSKRHKTHVCRRQS